MFAGSIKSPEALVVLKTMKTFGELEFLLRASGLNFEADGMVSAMKLEQIGPDEPLKLKIDGKQLTWEGRKFIFSRNKVFYNGEQVKYDNSKNFMENFNIIPLFFIVYCQKQTRGMLYATVE